MKKIFDFYAKTGKKDIPAFNDALPIGNGRMGAMVYGHPVNEKLILNADTLWLGKPGRKRYNKDFINYYKEIQQLVDENKIIEAEELIKLSMFSAPKGECIYSVAGEVRIDYKLDLKDVSNYKRCLDLDDGLVDVAFDINDNTINRRYFASYPDQLIINNICSKSPIDFVISLDREKIFDSIERIDEKLILKYKYNGKNTLYIVLNAVSDGSITIIGSNIKVANSTNTSINISLDTTYNDKNIKEALINSINKSDYNKVLSNHLSDYHSLFDRQSLKTSNDTINYFYELSRYLLIASSRSNSLPANLQGIWCQDIFPSWDSKYTININFQMNYWNAFRANLFECVEPYFDLLKRIHKNGKALAQNMYNARGFVAFHNSDMYGDVAPQDKYLPATSWPLGGAWVSLKIYEHYLYTKNKEFLNNYFYILKDSVDFYKDILILDENNHYVISPTISPENSYYLDSKVCHLSKGCAMDTEILTDLFTAYIKSREVLNLGVDKRAINILNNLMPLCVGKNGQIVEWNKDYIEAEPGHRHISQLYGLYPSNIINEKNEELFEAARRTIELRLQNGGGHTGWSKAWIMCMYARLNDGEAFIKNFNEFILKSTSSVGLDLHPPFQIDGNFGVAAAISEILIREDENELDLLPSIIGSGLERGEYTGIRLRNNLICDIRWDDYKLTYLKITGNASISIKCKNSSIFIPNDIVEISNEIEYK